MKSPIYHINNNNQNTTLYTVQTVKASCKS